MSRGTQARGARAVAALLAIAVGLLSGALVLAVGSAHAPTYVQDYYRSAAPELAKGQNVVNVILTDFRALDTLMETLVVVIAAFGVAGLIRGWEIGRVPPEARVSVEGRSGLLPEVVRLILPLAGLFAIALLVKGHDEPGGGFVAGLSLSIAAILSIAASARTWRAGMAVPAALAGALLLLGTLLASALVGEPSLTHAHGEFELLGSKWKWHTALVFDVGVVLAVAGALAAATRVLWPPPREVKR